MGWDEISKARQRLAREQGTVIKEWGGRLPTALVYPNSYYAGMSSLVVHAIYSLLNGYGNVVCERAFWEKENSTQQRPLLSLESQRPLSDFAVVAFSVTYEVDYLNIASILKAGGIPLYAADRDERHPLVIAGGPCIMANPMPLSPFFDCLCVGEAESIIPAILPILSEGIAGGRDELLKALASLPGIYVPQHYSGTPVVRQWVENLDDFPTVTTILTRDTELGDLYLIEVERGCHWGCRFCLVCHVFHPMRFRSRDKLIEQARQGLGHRKRIGLVGPVVSDYPHLEDLLASLRQMGAELSISSMRVRPLSCGVLREMVGGGAQTITLAPEAGSERLLQVINKSISKDDVLRAVSKAAELKIKQLKLYFMVGLPSETDEDIEEMVKLALDCKSILDRKHSSSRLALSVAPFVPKAGTPFQWLPMAPLAIVKRRLALLKSSLQPKGIKIKSESPAWSEVQGVLARGDVKLAEVLADVEQVSLSGWRQAVEKCHLDIDYYAHQRWDTTQQLPWSVIDSGIKRGHLERELNKALAQTTSTS